MWGIFKKNDFTVEDWMSPNEKEKLIHALRQSSGFVHVAIARKENYNVYYINGKQIFSREIKR